MAYYNEPTGDDLSGFYELFKFLNADTTAGLFFPIIILVTWVITFLALKGYSSSRAFTFASFFCTMLSIFLAIIDLISPRWMYMLIFFTAIGFVWLKLEAKSTGV